MYFKTKYVVFKPMYKSLLLTGLHINLIDQETFETQFQNAKPDPLTLGFSYIKKMQSTGSWLRSIVWFYSGKNDSIKSILFLLFISDLAMVTYITEVFKTFWWQASVFWFKKAVEKLAISHEKLQKWIGREGKFPMREDEFMKISDQHIILIGKGNIL